MNQPTQPQDSLDNLKIPEDIAVLLRRVIEDSRLQRIIRFYKALSPNKQRQLHRITRAMLDG